MTGQPRRVVLSPRAEIHLERLYRHILADAGPKQADRIVSQLLSFCGGLADFPMRGSARDDLFPGLRVTGYRRWATIAFTVEPATVTIQGVLWRGRDIAAAFADGDR